jgi:hypothetical protein
VGRKANGPVGPVRGCWAQKTSMTGPTREKTTQDGRKFLGQERKEKRERASAGPKGGGGPASLLRPDWAQKL